MKEVRKSMYSITLLPHNDDFKNLDKYLKELEEAKVDAINNSDPGVLDILEKLFQIWKLHLGTLANLTNYATANFWYKQGVKKSSGG